MASSTSSTSLTNSVNNTTLNDTLRLSGLASGLDTESIVASLMKAERAKYDKLVQQKQLIQWKEDAHLEINNLLKDFRDKYMSAMSPNNISTATSLIVNKVAITNGVTGVSITANGAVDAGSHTVKVSQIASGSSITSTASIGSGIDPYTALKDLPTDPPLEFTDGVMSFAINGETFTFNETDSLQSIVNRVNGDGKANVKMSYSELTGKLSITSKDLGADSTLTIQNISGNAFSATDSVFGIAEGTYTNGTNAKVQIDGIDVERDSNAFTIDGITYSLTAPTDGTANFTVSQDIDAAVNKIKDFVNAYNDLIDKLNTKLGEKKNIDYPPLTDDQRAAMTETQITQWETQAKSGILAGDDEISSMVDKFRSSFYMNVNEAAANGNTVGVGTLSYLDNGKLNVDEASLREALQNNPDQVASLLTSKAPTGSSDVFGDSGIATRLSNEIDSYLDDYNESTAKTLSDQMDDVEDDMVDMKEYLTDKENQYWTKYDALETALANLNSQSQWIASMMGGGSSSQS